MLAKALPWVWVLFATAAIAAVLDMMVDQPPLTMAVAGLLGLLVAGAAQRRSALGGGAVLMLGLSVSLVPDWIDGHLLSSLDPDSLLRLTAALWPAIVALLLAVKAPLEPLRLGPLSAKHPLGLACIPVFPLVVLGLVQRFTLLHPPSWLYLALSGPTSLLVLALAWRQPLGRGGPALLLGALAWLAALSTPMLSGQLERQAWSGERDAFLMYEVSAVGPTEVDELRERLDGMGLNAQVQLLGDRVQVELEQVADPYAVGEELLRPPPGGSWQLVDVSER